MSRRDIHFILISHCKSVSGLRKYTEVSKKPQKSILGNRDYKNQVSEKGCIKLREIVCGSFQENRYREVRSRLLPLPLHGRCDAVDENLASYSPCTPSPGTLASTLIPSDILLYFCRSQGRSGCLASLFSDPMLCWASCFTSHHFASQLLPFDLFSVHYFL